MSESDKFLSWLIDMCLASYLSKTPDVQIRRMAKKMKNLTSSKKSLSTLRLIVKSKYPSLLVRIAYEELLNNEC